MSKQSLRQARRRFLTVTASVLGGVGVIAAAIPFISYMRPSERAKVAGGPVEVDLTKVRLGEQITVKWQGKPIWLLHRTPEMLANLEKLTPHLRDPDSKLDTQQPQYAKNAYRSIKDNYFVCIGICTHLGCIPAYRPDIAPPDLGPKWLGGYFCPCHGSRFDLAGRVYKGVPAPTNLVIPPYRFVSNTKVVVGDDPINAG